MEDISITERENNTTQKLLRAFMQFRRADWHGEVVPGHKHSEIMVLVCLSRGAMRGFSDMKVSDISRLLQVTSPTVTQLLKGLEAEGLITRQVDLNDRRAVGVALTEKGQEVAQKAHHAFHDSFQGLVEYLGEEDSNQLAELLLKVNHYYAEKVSHLKSLWEDDKVDVEKLNNLRAKLYGSQTDKISELQSLWKSGSPDAEKINSLKSFTEMEGGHVEGD